MLFCSTKPVLYGEENWTEQLLTFALYSDNGHILEPLDNKLGLNLVFVKSLKFIFKIFIFYESGSLFNSMLCSAPHIVFILPTSLPRSAMFLS